VLAALLFWGGLPARAALEVIQAIAAGAPSLPLAGIGAVLRTENGFVTIMELVAGGPALRDGHLKVNDHISAVAQGNGDFVNCTNMTLDKVVELIRGRKGTTVRLKILAPDGSVKIVSLVRDVLKLYSSVDDEMASAETQIADEQRQFLVDYMKKKVDDVVQVTGLADAGKKSLEAAAAKAIDQCMEKAKASLADFLQSQIKAPSMMVNPFGTLSAMAANAKSTAYWAQLRGGNWPADQPAWTGGLAQTLTPAQAAAWQAAETKRTQAARAEIGDYLKAVSHYAEALPKRPIDQEISRIQVALDLPGDRVDKLNQFEKTFLAQTAESTRARAEKGLLAMRDDARESIIKERNFYNWVGPENDAGWMESLTGLLTPEEIKRMQTAQDDRITRRAAAMGDLLLSLMDEKCAFTDAQRRQLEPICQALVKNEPGLLADQNEDGYAIIPESQFYAAASTAAAGQVAAIIDPIQWQHWQDAAKLKDTPFNYGDQIPQLPPPEDPARPQPAAEPEDLERSISDYLADKTRARRAALFAAGILKAEDAARVMHLPADAAERLATAARGEAEAALDTWELSVEQSVRANLGNVTPDTVRERLANIQDYQFSQNNGQSGGSGESIWEKTLNSVATPGQADAWKKEKEARAAFQDKAIASTIVASFDERIGISSEQWAKLEPLVMQIQKDYSEDLGRYYQAAEGTAWYLQTYTMFLPVVGIPEKDMKALLTEDQWDRWSGSNLFMNASMNWQNIQQMHQQMHQQRF
jgi:hypothetical protein